MVSKPQVSAWIASERKKRGWKVEELSRRLVDAGYEAEIGTIRVWESARAPKQETIEALERIFGVPAPRETAPVMDSALAPLIAAQTEVLREIRDLLADLRGSAPSSDLSRLVTAAVEGGTIEGESESGRARHRSAASDESSPRERSRT